MSSENLSELNQEDRLLSHELSDEKCQLKGIPEDLKGKNECSGETSRLEDEDAHFQLVSEGTITEVFKNLKNLAAVNVTEGKKRLAVIRNINIKTLVDQQKQVLECLTSSYEQLESSEVAIIVANNKLYETMEHF